MKRYNFYKSLADSKRKPILDAVFDVLIDLDAVSVVWSDEKDDRLGSDARCLWADGRKFHVDYKVSNRGDYGDNAVEYKSSDTDPGWLLRPGKITDYVLWYYPTTGRYLFLPYQPLRRAALKYMDEWKRRYKCSEQDNGSYVSGCVYVPDDVLIAACEEMEALPVAA